MLQYIWQHSTTLSLLSSIGYHYCPLINIPHRVYYWNSWFILFLYRIASYQIVSRPVTIPYRILWRPMIISYWLVSHPMKISYRIVSRQLAKSYLIISLIDLIFYYRNTFLTRFLQHLFDMSTELTFCFIRIYILMYSVRLFYSFSCFSHLYHRFG